MPDVVNSDLGKPPARTRKAVTVFITGVIAGGLSGAALGVLWWSLAPRVSVVVTPDPGIFRGQYFIWGSGCTCRRIYGDRLGIDAQGASTG